MCVCVGREGLGYTLLGKSSGGFDNWIREDSPHSTKHVQQITATVWWCDDTDDSWQLPSQTVSAPQPETCVQAPSRPLVPSSPPRPGLWFLTWFSHVQNIAGPPACDDSLHRFLLCPCWTFRAGGSDVWDGEVRLKDSLAIYWPAWEQRLDVWVYWFPARILWVIRSRQESIEIFLLLL